MPNKKDLPLEDMQVGDETDDLVDIAEEEAAEGDVDEQAELANEEERDNISSEVVRMTSDIPVQVIAVLGKKTISMKDLMGFRQGQVLDFARPVNEIVDLIAGGKLVAKGELVDIDGKLGVRVVKIVR